MSEPNFSAFPWDRVPRLSRAQARLESVVARWLAAASSGSSSSDSSSSAQSTRTPRLDQLVGGPARARVVTPSAQFDPHAAICIVKAGGEAIECRGSSLAVRAVAQRVLGGPTELAVPRPLSLAEESIWSLVVASALEDLGIAGIVWPGPLRAVKGYSSSIAGAPPAKSPSPNSQRTDGPSVVELEIQCGPQIGFAIQLHVSANLELRAPTSADHRSSCGRVPTWAEHAMIDASIVVGRCGIARDDLARLRVRSLITLERVPLPGGTGVRGGTGEPSRYARERQGLLRGAELEILGGAVGLRASLGAVVGEVATGYVPRVMTLPEDAHVELTVALGTTQLSLRQVFELAVGQVVQLGRPLAGPFEVRAAGKTIGRGELVDVDGELAVRIVSLGDQE